MKILVLCPFRLDAGLLGKAVSLSDAPVRVLVKAGEEQAAARYGAGIVHALAGEIEDEADFALWLAEKIKTWNCDVILAPAEIRLRSVMPTLARHLRAGLTADCTALSVQNGRLLQTRPAFGNSLIADIIGTSRIQMATVRPGIFRPAEKPGSPGIIREHYTPLTLRVRQTAFTPYSEGRPLSQADVIFAAGLGIGSKEGFQRLRQIAERCGAAVGASRAAVDAGFAPYRCQIGLTGVTVCPKLYIAVGISGAVQHLAGMSGAEKIVAINSDPKAPIFDYADCGVVAPWNEVFDTWEDA